VWKEAEEIVTFSKEKGITIASYAGLVPITKAPGGPVDPVLKSIAEKLGKDVPTSHVLTKWLLQKGAVVITYVPTDSSPLRISHS